MSLVFDNVLVAVGELMKECQIGSSTLSLLNLLGDIIC